MSLDIQSSSCLSNDYVPSVNYENIGLRSSGNAEGAILDLTSSPASCFWHRPIPDVLEKDVRNQQTNCGKKYACNGCFFLTPDN